MKKENLIKLAFVAHPHGIKGEAELRLLNPNTEESVLEDGVKIWLYPSSDKSRIDPQGEQWTLSKVRFGNKVIGQLEGVKDRNHLETLIPFEIFLERELFPEADEDEFYLVDLIDLSVVDPDGNELGVLESFSDNGMQYLFEVRLNDGTKITLPYVETFFPEVDVEKGKIVMIMPEYTE